MTRLVAQFVLIWILVSASVYWIKKSGSDERAHIGNALLFWFLTGLATTILLAVVVFVF